MSKETPRRDHWVHFLRLSSTLHKNEKHLTKSKQIDSSCLLKMKKAMIRVGKGLIASTRTTLSRNSATPATQSSLEATYMQSRTRDVRDKYSVPLPSWELDHMKVRRIEGNSRTSNPYAGPIPSWELDHMNIRRIAGSSLCNGVSSTELKANTHWILKEE